MTHLKVKMTGLFMVVREEGNKKFVTVLAPDGRNPQRFERTTMEHYEHTYLDGKEVVPHVGVLRVPARHLREAPPGARLSDGELVIRLDRHEVVWPGGASKAPEFSDLKAGAPKFLANFNEFASVKLDPKCLGPAEDVPDTVLARMRLTGGTISPRSESGTGGSWEDGTGGSWKIPGTLDPAGVGMSDERALAGSVEWAVALPDEECAILLKPFDGGEVIVIPLEARDGKIEVSLVNLCANNPLGWDEIAPLHDRGDQRDLDFKWFYFLMQDLADIKKRLGSDELPVPIHQGGGAGGWPFCMLSFLVYGEE